MIALADRLYGGRTKPILVAWTMTVALPMLALLDPSMWRQPDFMMFWTATVLIFVGLPSFLGIALVMIPTEGVLRQFGKILSKLGVIGANCLLVGVLWASGIFSANPQADRPFFDSIPYLSFAFAAAVIWLLSDRLLRSPHNV